MFEELMKLVPAEIENEKKAAHRPKAQPDSKAGKYGVVDQSRTKVSQSSRAVESWILGTRFHDRPGTRELPGRGAW